MGHLYQLGANLPVQVLCERPAGARQHEVARAGHREGGRAAGL